MRRIKIILRDVKRLDIEVEDDDATEVSIAGLDAAVMQADGNVPIFGFIPTPTGAPDEEGEEDAKST